MTESPNAEQIRNWNVVAGPQWVLRQELLDRQLGLLGAQGISALGDLSGLRVLDIGCGCGATSLTLADAVGPTGSVTGVDLSGVMLARARERAAGRANLAFIEADAQVATLGEAVFDKVFSRFGVMFFANPVAAFGNVRRALRPGGSLAFVCWQPLDANPWMLIPLQAVLALGLPTPPVVQPDGPGPFSLSSADHVRSILGDAGFTDVSLARGGAEISLGGSVDLDTAVVAAAQHGPAGFALRDAPESTVTAAHTALRAALAPYHGPQGVRLRGSTWIVSARAPEPSSVVVPDP